MSNYFIDWRGGLHHEQQQHATWLYTTTVDVLIGAGFCFIADIQLYGNAAYCATWWCGTLMRVMPDFGRPEPIISKHHSCRGVADALRHASVTITEMLDKFATQYFRGEIGARVRAVEKQSETPRSRAAWASIRAVEATGRLPKTRTLVLAALDATPRSIQELSRELSIERTTMRYHLRALESEEKASVSDAGWVKLENKKA